MDSRKGRLIISLDFELLWGVFDVIDYQEKILYFQNTRNVIPKILNLFNEKEIHCTWATVGMLFNENWQEWQQNIPVNLPSYRNHNLSAYHFGQRINLPSTKELCFATDIIKRINSTAGQEVGTHTYSHYYCQEENQTLEQFTADLEKAVELGKKFDIDIKSLVFPRNQFKKEYMEICYRHGIKSVRTNPDIWFWKNPASNSFLIRLFRTADAYNLFAKRRSYSFSDIKVAGILPVEQKSSRFYRPFEKNIVLHKLKMKRIKSEMTAAAKRNEIYHLWWHPHNFGSHPTESLKDLISITNHFCKLRKKYSFQSLNMEELREALSNNA